MGTLETTVYVVDSDTPFRHNLRRLFATWAVRVESFATAKEFLQAVKRADSACVIADANLPDMAGVELIDAMRAQHCSIPTIILAAEGDVMDAVKAIQAGAVDFIEKPPQEDALMRRVTQVFEY